MKITFHFGHVLAMFCMLFSAIAVHPDEYIDIWTKSDKPSVANALRGTKGYTYALISNGVDVIASKPQSVPFIDIYFSKEIQKWMSEICPDASPGLNYRYPMCANVQIAAKYNHTGQQTYRAGAGWMAPDVYVNAIGSYVIELSFGGEYVYQYKLPSFKINDGAYGEHTVYYHLKNTICGSVCRYDKSATPQLAKIMTQWREVSLKNYFDEKGDEIEGIYESTRANTNGHTAKYKLALKKNNDDRFKYTYYLIYLSGANQYKDWDEGEIKAFLYPTSTPNVYKTEWLMYNKTLNSDFYITIDNSGFITTNVTNGEELFLKLYPTAQSQKPRQPEKWSGSGFALNNGYIVTNYHVAEGANSILVYQTKDDGTRNVYKATLAVSDKTNDIAILKINDSNFKGFGNIPYKIKTGLCEVGESVWALGFPMTDIMGDEIKFTDGKISARSGIDGMTSVYQISVPIQHGNSGGPLFDTKGNIVGITSSGLNRDLQTENVNYAIKISYLRLLIEDSLPTSIIPQGTVLQGQSLTTQIKLAKKYVFYIECSK